MTIEEQIPQVKALLNSSYIINKHDVEERDIAGKLCVKVKLSCVNIVDNASELTKLLRMVRKKVPRTHAVHFLMKFVC